MAKKLSLDQALLRIAEELEAGARAPNIKKYKPHAKQHKFHSSPKKKKLYIGGNRSGKTTGGVTEAIWRATSTHPYRPELNTLGPTRGRVVAVDFTQGVEKIIFPQYKQWLYPSAMRGGSWTTAYVPSLRTLYFENGSEIEFMSYDQALDKFAGTSRHWTHFDEEPPKSIFNECIARLMDTNGEFWITMTPVEGMTWIYEDLYEPNVGKDDPSVEIVEISTLENPYLTQEGIQNVLASYGEEDKEIRIQGGFVRKGGRVYKNFDPTVGGIHVLSEDILEPKSYFPPDKWMWGMSLDHGLNNPTAILWHAVNSDGFVVVFDEWYKNEYTVEQHAKVLKQKIKEHGRYPDLLVGDPAIKQRSGHSGTSIQQEYQKYGFSFILGNNDVKSGIIRVKKYFNSAPYPGSADGRRHPLYGGTDRLNGAPDSVRIHSEDGTYPRLVIAPRCTNLIKELKSYRWKTYTDKKKQFENNPYDEPHKKDDHACDSLRYFIMTRPDLVAENQTDSTEAIRAAFKELEDGLAFPGSGIADPYSRLNPLLDENGEYAADQWHPGSPLPSGGTNWELDEHLGGLM